MHSVTMGEHMATAEDKTHDTDDRAEKVESEIRSAILRATEMAQEFKLGGFLLECMADARAIIERRNKLRG